MTRTLDESQNLVPLGFAVGVQAFNLGIAIPQSDVTVMERVEPLGVFILIDGRGSVLCNGLLD